nr:MAG: hypothetical protein [Lake Baikal virophage 14]
MNNNPNLPGEPLENEFPYYFQDVLDVFQQQFPNMTDNQRREKWTSFRIRQKIDYSFELLETETTEGDLGGEILVLTPAQRNLVKNIHQQYNHWRRHLYPRGGGSLEKKRYYPFLH